MLGYAGDLREDSVRAGCVGCLATVVGVAIVVAAVGGALLALTRALERPVLPGAPGGPDDAALAQQKLFEAFRRGGRGRAGTPAAVVLTEREVDALLSRHLAEAADLPVARLGVRLPAGGIVEVAGPVPLRVLLAEALPQQAIDLLPRAWRERPVWVRLRARPTVEDGAAGRRYLRLAVERVAVGRLPLPALTARLLLPPSALQLLRWPLPEPLYDVTVDAGRVTLRARPSSPARTATEGRK